jgi:toxin HigB-1
VSGKRVSGIPVANASACAIASCTQNWGTIGNDQSGQFARKAKKQLPTLPAHILNKLETWVRAVELDGLESVRTIPGYHDEPLKGKRQGERSVRLSRAYRAIYEIKSDDSIEFVSIEEVSKHEY